MIKKNILKIFLFFIFIFTFNNAMALETINVHIFHGETCPHCKEELKILKELQNDYNFVIKDYEVYYNKDNQELMKDFEKAYNTSFSGVPTVIIGKDYFSGTDKEKTELLIKKYLDSDEDYLDPYDFVVSKNKNSKDFINNKSSNQKLIIFNKEITLESVGPVFFGVLLGLLDGVNPCMFGVLIFLLTYLISIGSKKRVLRSGLIFVVTVFVFYFVVMYLMHNLLFSTTIFLPYISIIKIIIGLIALFMGIIEIKDFFFYGKGFSLAIPKVFKPALEKITKKGSYFSAFLLAALSSLVELPCTIGIPLAYITAVSNKINIFLGLFIYNLFFIIPLFIIILSVYFSFNKIKNENKEITINKESNKKIMRLVAGIILLIMGILFILGKI